MFSRLHIFHAFHTLNFGTDNQPLNTVCEKCEFGERLKTKVFFIQKSLTHERV